MKKVEFGSDARANLVKGIDILADAVVSTLNSDYLTQGPKVREFESKFED